MKQILLTMIFVILVTSCNSYFYRGKETWPTMPISQETTPVVIAQTMVRFVDSTGAILQVFHFVQEPNTIRLTLPDHSELTLTSAVSASGARYTSSDGWEFWEHQQGCTLSKGDSLLFRGKMQ